MTAVARVDYAGYRRPHDLVAPLPVRAVFSPAEIRACGGAANLSHWAGRLAAKRAVLDVLGAPPAALTEIEILPERRACYDPARCARGHPPAAHLRGGTAGYLGPGRRIALSISHTGRTAIAVAVVHRELIVP